MFKQGCVMMFKNHLSKLVVGAIVLLDVVLFEPLNGFSVVHPLERPLGGFEVLGRENTSKGMISRSLGFKLGIF